MGKVDTDSRYKHGFFDKLARHPAIDEIENFGMDDGRFFVHLKAPYAWAESHPSDPQRTQSFGGIGEARKALCRIVQMGADMPFQFRYMAQPPQSYSTPLYHAHVDVFRLSDFARVATLHPVKAAKLADDLNAAQPDQDQAIIDAAIKEASL